MKRIIIAGCCLLTATTLQAAELKGEAELGWVMTKGNTESDNLSAKAKATASYTKVRHNLKLEALNSSSTVDGVKTRSAERYLFDYKFDYKLTEIDYLFANLNYESDRFSGYQHRTSELFGYGREFIKDETLLVNGEISAGARQSKLVVPVNGDDSTSETVGKLLGHLNWKISETSDFDEELSVEAGSDSTITKSVSALKVKINSDLAMKLTYMVKQTSEVPPGARETDSETTVTLVYSF